MGSNCQDIFSDFPPSITKQVCSSPLIFGGSEILSPVITIILAPFLDAGPSLFDSEKLADKIRIYV